MFPYSSTNLLEMSLDERLLEVGDGDDLDAVAGADRLEIVLGHDRPGEAEPFRFGDARRRLRDAAHFARQPHLAEDDRPARHRAVEDARGERGRDSQVRGRLVDVDAADGIDKDVL